MKKTSSTATGYQIARPALIARIWNAGILLLGNPGQTPEAIEIPRVIYRETPNGIFCTSYRMRNWKYDMQGRMVVSSVQVYFVDAQGFTTPADDWETRFLPGIAETLEGAVVTMIRANLG